MVDQRVKHLEFSMVAHWVLQKAGLKGSWMAGQKVKHLGSWRVDLMAL